MKYVAVGKCSVCGKEFVRPAVCTDATCDCESARVVPLHPALVLPARLHKRLQKIADLAGIPLEEFVNALLLEAAKQKLRRMGLKKYE